MAILVLSSSTTISTPPSREGIRLCPNMIMFILEWFLFIMIHCIFQHRFDIIYAKAAMIQTFIKKINRSESKFIKPKDIEQSDAFFDTFQCIEYHFFCHKTTLIFEIQFNRQRSLCFISLSSVSMCLYTERTNQMQGSGKPIPAAPYMIPAVRVPRMPADWS